MKGKGKIQGFLLGVLLLMTAQVMAQSAYLTFVTDTAIYLRWQGYRATMTDQTDLIGYKVFRSENEGPFVLADSLPFLKTRQAVQPLLGYKTDYYFSLFAQPPGTAVLTEVTIDSIFGDPQNRSLFEAMALTNPTTGYALGEVLVDKEFTPATVIRYRVMAILQPNDGGASYEELILTTEPIASKQNDEIPPVEDFSILPANEGAELKWPKMRVALRNGEVVTYQVYRSASSIGPFEPANLYGIFNATVTFGGNEFNPDSTHYLDRYLNNGQTYFYKVHSVNAFGLESRPSVTKPVVPAYVSQLAPPNGLTGEQFGNGLKLQWDHPDRGQVAFQVYKAVGKGTFELVSGHHGFPYDTAASHLDFGIAEGGTYYYYIKAAKGGKAGLPSDTLRIRIPDHTQPVAPQNVQAIAEQGRITLSWDAVDDELLGYQVYRFNDDDFRFDLLLFDEYLEDTFYVDTLPATSQTTYGYEVTATDKSYNTSPRSKLVKARLPDIKAPPEPYITRIERNGNIFTISHTGSNAQDVAHFSLYRSAERSMGIMVDTSSGKVMVDTLEESGVYYYSVTATDEAGNESEPSEFISTRYEKYSKPLPPKNGSAEWDKYSIVLRWDLPAEGPVAGFVVTRTNPDGTIATVAEIDQPKGYCRDLYVERMESYTYRIKTRDDRWRVSLPLIIHYEPEEE